MHKKRLCLSFLRYEHESTKVAREQIQQIEDEGGHSFEIENVVEETLERNSRAYHFQHRTVKQN